MRFREGMTLYAIAHELRLRTSRAQPGWWSDGLRVYLVHFQCLIKRHAIQLNIPCIRLTTTVVSRVVHRQWLQRHWGDWLYGDTKERETTSMFRWDCRFCVSSTQEKELEDMEAEVEFIPIVSISFSGTTSWADRRRMIILVVDFSLCDLRLRLLITQMSRFCSRSFKIKVPVACRMCK